MASINMTFSDTTPGEARAATFELNRVNAVRTAHNQPEYSGVKEMIVDRILTSMLPEWIEREANAKRQEEDVRNLWRDATDAQRLAAINALAPPTGE